MSDGKIKVRRGLHNKNMPAAKPAAGSVKAKPVQGTDGAAQLYCVTPPDERQKKGFSDFLERTYGARPEIEVITDPSLVGGFRLVYGDNVYDWSAQGRISKLREDILSSRMSTGGVTPLLRDAVKNLQSAIEDWSMPLAARESGTVLSVGDGIVRVSGLELVEYGEIVSFECGLKGMVQELAESYVGVILFGNDREVEEGSAV